ncbi:MAG: peptigoglycan-binding protein LysM [Methylomonas sp.]|uniref:LysM peptidoglycan-binding domain-containing protein n=1 Tax=Flavobacterium sp. TaxID=239 RepID=UPI000D29C055|nr:N-acetylmuramidase domain-containing protein [Flavobacterium sp.]MBA4155674.1 peptigoglycan-binding protein LysM [Flavobacterium sp.]PPD36187.1 MAG: peptigoglycan-binding protein LysM [Methylomonas sp.]
MKEVYIVKKGDTLTKIAKQNGLTVKELKNLNHLNNPNKIAIGQKINLRKDKVLGFQALLLENDRVAIKGLNYRFEFKNGCVVGKTGEDGLTKQIMTETPFDEVRIFVERLDKSVKEIAKVTSGYGNKLVTLVSPSIKLEAITQDHPNLKQGEIPQKKEKTKPIYDPNAKQPATIDKKELGAKVTNTKTEDHKPVVKVEGDIPELSFLGEYVGGEITKLDIEQAAAELRCEPGLIYAIARQESASSSFIKINDKTVPTILYERHKFSEFTKHSYDKLYHDISGRAYKRARKNKKGFWVENKTGELVSENDVYGSSGVSQYRRLVKAYQLDQDAALKACSWGKFQIMGFNFKNAGFGTVNDFVKAMCKSDAEHIKAFLKFAKSNKLLLQGLRNKDYKKIAQGHNGDNWRSINPDYPTNIEIFYKNYTNNNKTEK